jgi:pectin methylesterase-like acyl-CoA thioesterase
VATTWTVGPSGDFSTIQAAINAAGAGDTISIAAGTYNESLTINKALTIQGANAGIAGTGSRGPETVLNWPSGDMATITTTNLVSFDGLRFVANTDVITTHTQDSNITFTNSTFDIQSGGTGGNAFYLSQPAHFTFSNNLVDAHAMPAPSSSRSAIPRTRRTPSSLSPATRSTATPPPM